MLLFWGVFLLPAASLVMSIVKLGKYSLTKELGRGAFATVFQAKDSQLGRNVAIKILHPALSLDSLFVTKFYREARLIAKLAHPNIVTVHEASQDQGRLYISMALANNGSIQDRLDKSSSIPWNTALPMLKSICSALSYAHGAQILHRDIKPSNILLFNDTPWLSDFGFAEVIGNSEFSRSMSGGISGTPAYIAPEIWEHQEASKQSDIYALGCVIYEILTGKKLFQGSNPMQIMRAHDKGIEKIYDLPAGVPDGVNRILQLAVNRQPSQRFSSIDELWEALNQASNTERRTISVAPQVRTANFSTLPQEIKTSRTQAKIGSAQKPQNSTYYALERISTGRLITSWTILTVSCFATLFSTPGISIQEGGLISLEAIIASLLIGFLNIWLRRLLTLLSCPLILITTAILLPITNALYITFSSWIVQNLFKGTFNVDGFFPVILASIIISIVSFFVSIVLPN